MYKIGELSKLSRLPVKTLRFYDSEGLLPPDYVDGIPLLRRCKTV